MTAAIDPGRYKTGVAFADAKTLLFSCIVPAHDEEIIFYALRTNDFTVLEPYRREGSIENISGKATQKILIGNGTSSKEFRAHFPCPFTTADEYGTTLAARKIYFSMHPPRGLKKLLPLSLQTPPRDIDDLAAYAIILKYFNF